MCEWIISRAAIDTESIRAALQALNDADYECRSTGGPI